MNFVLPKKVLGLLKPSCTTGLDIIDLYIGPSGSKPSSKFSKLGLLSLRSQSH